MTEPVLAFRVHEPEHPEVVVRVNFGVFAGRNATQAEIDDLAHSLRDIVEMFSIVAVERHEFGGDVEAMLRQIVIEIDEDVEALSDRVIARAEKWASDCIAVRSDLGELSEF
jgi:hypothetical protein